VKESADAETGRVCSVGQLRNEPEESENPQRVENSGGGGERSEMNSVMEAPKKEEERKRGRERPQGTGAGRSGTGLRCLVYGKCQRGWELGDRLAVSPEKAAGL